MSNFVNPKTPGTYRRQYIYNERLVDECSYWDGKVWHLSAPTADLAEHNFKLSCGSQFSQSGFQEVPWEALQPDTQTDEWIDGRLAHPAAPGLFYRRPSKEVQVNAISYFDGKTWFVGAPTVRKAYQAYDEDTESGVQNHWYWRPVNPHKQVKAVLVQP